jgi:predicted thioesterase
MNNTIKEGLKKRIEITTAAKDSARSYGSGLVDVFASMENTALQAVSTALEEGYNTVGTAVNVKHIKATPIGMKVYCVAELIKVEGSKLRFQVEAFDEEGKIGFGTHDRYIINMASFLQNLQKT